MYLDLIKDALVDHVIISGENETDFIYDEHACAEVKSLFDDSHIQNDVFIYPTNTEHYTEPDYWCAISWVEAGHLHTYGFNWMSAQRKRSLDKFNEVAEKGWI